MDALDVLHELTHDNPPQRLRLIRRHGPYASRPKGRWVEMPWVAERHLTGRKPPINGTASQMTLATSRYSIPPKPFARLTPPNLAPDGAMPPRSQIWGAPSDAIDRLTRLGLAKNVDGDVPSVGKRR